VSDRYDAIVIGSGIGGLNCGAFLTRAGMKVLVLEKHDRIGGYAHSFKRRSFTFESSVHSVSMNPNGVIMYMLRLLGIDRMVQPRELHSMFSIQSPNMTMSVPARYWEIVEFLNATFPGQREQIGNLIKEAHTFYDHIAAPIFRFEEMFTPEDTVFVSRFHNQSYQQFIQNIITDGSLRELLFGQWPYIGSTPEYAPSLFSFMMFLIHLFEGSHSCAGGFATLAGALASVITGRGGAVKTKAEVQELFIEHGKIRAVKTVAGDLYETKIAVSNVSPYILHTRMIGQKDQGRRWVRRLSLLNPSLSSVIVYLGLKKEFYDFIPDNIRFWYGTADYKRIFTRIMADRKEPIDHLIMLKVRDNSEYPTLTLMNFVRKSFSADWKSEKMAVAERMIAKADALHPGLKNAIEVMEVGSPDTFERYTANTDGALYGFENNKSMYHEAKMPIKTHCANLYQTGHWGKPGCGIWNVMINSYTASKVILQEN
jgi:prolycopene isomerase